MLSGKLGLGDTVSGGNSLGLMNMHLCYQLIPRHSTGIPLVSVCPSRESSAHTRIQIHVPLTISYLVKFDKSDDVSILTILFKRISL